MIDDPLDEVFEGGCEHELGLVGVGGLVGGSLVGARRRASSATSAGFSAGPLGGSSTTSGGLDDGSSASTVAASVGDRSGLGLGGFRRTFGSALGFSTGFFFSSIENGRRLLGADGALGTLLALEDAPVAR